MADAFEVREYLHARFGLDAGNEAFAAARYDDIEAAPQPREHETDGFAIRRRHELDGGFGELCGSESGDEAVVDGAARVETFRTAAQDRRVTGFQAQPTGVGGDVGAALVNDADDAERRAHALDGDAVRAVPGGDRCADRIGECGNFLEPARDGVDAGGVEHQAIEERPGRAAITGGGKVEGVGGENIGRAGAQQSRRLHQREILGRRRCERHLALRGARALAQAMHDLADGVGLDVFGAGHGRDVLSRKWIRSPRWSAFYMVWNHERTAIPVGWVKAPWPRPNRSG